MHRKSFHSLLLHHVFFLKTSSPIYSDQISHHNIGKGEGSSPCKGKEIAADDPATKTTGEDAPLSELECSKDEEGGRNPNSEYAPFIDPWYDTHTHFSVLPDDYLSPSSGHVWLSICRHDMEVSWAPLASSIPDVDICQDTSLPVPILFEFGSGTSLGWKEWVDEELSNMGFMVALQQAGVLKAIVSSRCLSNYRDLFNFRHLVRRWCTVTHTFFLSCSEISVTLEDVANQLLLPILSDVDPSNIELSPEKEVVEAELKKGMSGNAKLSHLVGAFSKAFDVVCTAFFAFWLYKFIFGTHPHYAVKPLYF